VPGRADALDLLRGTTDDGDTVQVRLSFEER